LHEFLWGELADWYVEVSKVRIGDSSSSSSSTSTVDTTATATASTTTSQETALMSDYVLLYVWSRGLKLLHPYMPFVTETLYQNISAPTPTPTHARSIMVSAWPLLVTLDQLQQRSDSSSGSSYHIADTDRSTNTDMPILPPSDPQSIRHFSKLKAIVKTIRNMRTTYGIKASHKIHATVYVPMYGGEAGNELHAELGVYVVCCVPCAVCVDGV